MTARNVGAGLGLLAAAVTVGHIGVGLYKAAAPVATPVLLASASVAPISLQGLHVDDRELLPGGWTAGSVESRGSSRTLPLGTVALPVGRAPRVDVAFSVPKDSTATCRIEPRPHGACVLRVTFTASSELRCEFDCRPEGGQP